MDETNMGYDRASTELKKIREMKMRMKRSDEMHIHPNETVQDQRWDQSFHYRKDGVIKMGNIKGVELKAAIIYIACMK